MKNFKLILMVALVLMFSSHKAFATDDWAKTFLSGVSGVCKGDWGGVSAGLTNFATTTPVLSSVYSGVQWTGAQLNNIRTDMGTAYATSGALGLGSYALTAPLSGISKIGSYGASTIGSYASQIRIDKAQLKAIDTTGYSKLGSPVGAGIAIPKPLQAKVEALKKAAKIEAVKQDFNRNW